MNTGSTYPANFYDPITFELMCDPVVCSDGRTYERSTATRLNRSPYSRQPLQVLVDNVDLRSDIFERRPKAATAYRRLHGAQPTPRTTSLRGARPASPPFPTANEATICKAQNFCDANMARDAVVLLQETLNEFPDDDGVRDGLARAFVALGRDDKALPIVKDLYYRFRSVHGLVNWAVCETLMGNFIVAEALVSRIKAVDNDDPRALTLQGMIEIKKGNFFEAQRIFELVVERSRGQDIRWHVWLFSVDRALAGLCAIAAKNHDIPSLEKWSRMGIGMIGHPEFHARHREAKGTFVSRSCT
jgi:tetratricopeptide (TPR) repeat protein